MRKSILALAVITLIAPTLITGQTSEISQCRVHNSIRGDSAIPCPNSERANIDTYPVCCLLSSIYRITDWITAFVLALSVLFVLIGGFYIITAGGSADAVNRGRNFIKFAVIGLIIALLAKAVPGIVKAVIA